MFLAVLRIRDVYPGSRIRLFSIPDPNCLHPGSRFLIKEFKYFNPQKSKKIQNFSKIKLVKLKIMCLQVSYKKKK